MGSKERGRGKEQWFDFCVCGSAGRVALKAGEWDQSSLFGTVDSGKLAVKQKIQAHQCEVLLVFLGIQYFISFLNDLLYKANKPELIYTHT